MNLTAQDLERYQRQILIIGKEGQTLLSQKKVLQVGAGGLGGPLSLYLVSAGIGELVLFENDIVSLSNLSRQILYKTSDIGGSKADLAKKRLNALNPNVKITVIKEWLTKKNAVDYLNGIDYLVDASDNFETKFLINDLGIEYNIPFTIAGIQSYEGQLFSCIPNSTACYRCVFSKPPKVDKSKPVPVISATCGIVGSLQAVEVLKALLNQGKRVLDHFLMIDLLDMNFTKIPIKINPKCKCQK